MNRYQVVVMNGEPRVYDIDEREFVRDTDGERLVITSFRQAKDVAQDLNEQDRRSDKERKAKLRAARKLSGFRPEPEEPILPLV